MSRVRPRFYLPAIDAGGLGTLAEDESVHLTRVLRLGTGDQIDVFDGRGGMHRAVVEHVARGEVRVRVSEPVAAAAEALVRVTLVMSVLKSDKMDDVVRDAAMLGVAAVQPVVAERSEVRLAALERAHRADRWQRIAVSSVKQSGRAVVPVVHPPLSLAAWMKLDHTKPVLVLQEPAAGPGVSLRETPRAASVQLVVGPEGGWSPDEIVSFAAAGYTAITVGPRTLRADAAPLVAMSALFEQWNAW